jgi:hypothetical protein
MGRRCEPAPPNFADVFLGYPPQLVAEICAVSVGTAREYKRATRSPSPAVLRLWGLYVAGRIMPESWSQYAFGKNELLWQRESMFSVDEEALNAYTYRMQLLRRAQERATRLEYTTQTPQRHYLLVRGGSVQMSFCADQLPSTALRAVRRNAASFNRSGSV